MKGRVLKRRGQRVGDEATEGRRWRVDRGEGSETERGGGEEIQGKR